MAGRPNGKRPKAALGSPTGRVTNTLPIAVCHNWADAALHPVPRETNPLRRSWGLGDAFVVGYSGNLGRAHDLGTVVGAMTAMAGDGRVRLGRGGRGQEADRLESD